MNHITGHPHAFIVGGRVIDIHVFDESAHDSSLLNDAQKALNADAVVCLCDHTDKGNPKPDVYHTWDGTNFAEPIYEDLVKLEVVPAINTELMQIIQAQQVAETPAALTETTTPTA